MINIPKVTFSSENKIKSNNDYPRLTLDYQERALIVAIEPQPEMEYVHTLRAPEIGPNGKVIKEVKQGKRGEYEQTSMEFIGQHLCFGNFDVLSQKGVDPDSCPTCAAAVEEEGIDAPKERYAMHVLRYGLQPNSWQIKDPFSISCEAWVFAGNRFNALVDLAAEWEDLRKHDLKLGPCENKGYQKYDINVSAKAEWLANADRREMAKNEYENNKTNDLASLIGRKVDRSTALEDIGRVLDRWAQVNGKSSPDVAAPIQQANSTMDADIAALLGDDTPKESANVPDPFSATTSDDESSTEPVVETKKPAAKKSSKAAAPVEEDKSVGALSFADLIGEL